MKNLLLKLNLLFFVMITITTSANAQFDDVYQDEKVKVSKVDKKMKKSPRDEYVFDNIAWGDDSGSQCDSLTLFTETYRTAWEPAGKMSKIQFYNSKTTLLTTSYDKVSNVKFEGKVSADVLHQLEEIDLTACTRLRYHSTGVDDAGYPIINVMGYHPTGAIMIFSFRFYTEGKYVLQQSAGAFANRPYQTMVTMVTNSGSYQVPYTVPAGALNYLMFHYDLDETTKTTKGKVGGMAWDE